MDTKAFLSVGGRSQFGDFARAIFAITVIPAGLTKAVASSSFSKALLYAVTSLIVLEIHLWVTRESAIKRTDTLRSVRRNPSSREILLRFGLLLIMELVYSAVAQQFASDGKPGMRQLIVGGAGIFNVVLCLMGHLSARASLTISPDRILLQNLFRRQVLRRGDVTNIHIPVGDMPPVPFLVLQHGTRVRVDAFGYLPPAMGFGGLQPEELRKLEGALQVSAGQDHLGGVDEPTAPDAGSEGPPTRLPAESLTEAWKVSISRDRVLRRFLRNRIGVATLVAILGLSVASVAIPGIQERRGFERIALTAQGHVIGSAGGCSRVRVAFRTQAGQQIESSAPVFDCESYGNGQFVDVLYDPQNPARVELAAEAQNFLYQLILAGLLLAAAVGLSFKAWRWTKRLKRTAQLPSASHMKGRIEAEGRRFLLWSRTSLSMYPSDAGANSPPLASIPLMRGHAAEDLPPEFPIAVKGMGAREGVLVSRHGNRMLWPRRRAQ